MTNNPQATAKKIAADLTKRLTNSHDDVFNVLKDTQLMATHKGLNPDTFILVHEGKIIQDGYTFTSTVETTSEKISMITTEAENKDATVVATVIYHNTAHGDGTCKWEEKRN